MRRKLEFQADRIEAVASNDVSAWVIDDTLTNTPSKCRFRLDCDSVRMRKKGNTTTGNKTGKALERKVANLYRAMGAWKVEHDVLLAGHQIDVYVEMGGQDGWLHRIAVEVKDWQTPVGIKVVSDWTLVVDGLRRAGLVDEGVIVSLEGFTRPARRAVDEHNSIPMRLLELADLRIVLVLIW